MLRVDLTQAGTEQDDHDTIELVAASAESLAARVEELGLVLADPKLRLLGSSPSLVERAMARLEALGAEGRRSTRTSARSSACSSAGAALAKRSVGRASASSSCARTAW